MHIYYNETMKHCYQAGILYSLVISNVVDVSTTTKAWVVYIIMSQNGTCEVVKLREKDLDPIPTGSPSNATSE